MLWFEAETSIDLDQSLVRSQTGYLTSATATAQPRVVLYRSGGSNSDSHSVGSEADHTSLPAENSNSCAAIANYVFQQAALANNTPVGCYANPNEDPREAVARESRLKRLRALAEQLDQEEERRRTSAGQPPCEAEDGDHGKKTERPTPASKKTRSRNGRHEKGTQRAISLFTCESRGPPKDIPLSGSEGAYHGGTKRSAGKIPKGRKQPLHGQRTITAAFSLAEAHRSGPLPEFYSPGSPSRRHTEPGAC